VNLASIIEGHPGDAVALISRNRSTTYGELRSLVAAMRGGLAARGVAAADRVALILGNERDFVVAYLAVVGLGAVAVPLNPVSPPAELERQIAAVTASAVVVGPSATEGRPARPRLASRSARNTSCC